MNQFTLTHRPRWTSTCARNCCGTWGLLALLSLSLPACAGEPKASRPVSTTSTGEDWPSFLGPRGDNSSIETGVQPELWQPSPRLLWRLPLGVSYGAPTVSREQLFQFDRYDDRERLTCYNAATAEKQWQWETQVQYDDMFGYNNGPRCSPLIDGELIFVYGVTGQLSCVDRPTGELRWTKNMNQEYGVVPNFFGVASNPYVFEDLLLVMVGGSTPETRGLPTERLAQVEPNGSAIVALDKRTGDEVYRVGNGLASYSSVTVRMIEGEPTGLAFLRDGLLAWHPRSGKQLFEFPWRADMLESVNAAMPVVDGNRILISEAYDVGSAVLDVEQGEPRVVWQDGGPRSTCRFRAHWSTPALIDGHLYGSSGRNGPDTDFRCVRFNDGAVLWNDRNRDRQRSSVLQVDGYLIVLGETGLLELIQPSPEQINVLAEVDLSELTAETGEPLLDYPCWAAPVLSHGRLYVRGNQHLLCLELIPAASRADTEASANPAEKK